MGSETAASKVARANDEKATDAQFLTTEMYADQDDLAVRIRTHELYTTPKVDFAQWVLKHAAWDGSQTVLDIGCGNGMYFGPLRERAGLVLGADLSFGMLQDASPRALSERVICINSDAMRIPLPDGCCDRVLANHMLYHVPDILAALGEMRRVLRPDGVLLTTTNARLAMRRFFDEILGACAALGYQFSLPEAPIVHRFSLDDGGTLLDQVFEHVTRYQLESKLVFPTPEPALAYIYSMRSVYGNQLPSGLSWDRLMAQVETQIRRVVEREDAYQVPKTTGLFAATKAGAHDDVMKGNLARLGTAVRRELCEAEVRQARRAAEDGNAKLYRETRRQASRLAALLEIGSEISATLDLSTVSQRIASHAQNLLEADDSDVYLLDPAGEVLTAIASLGEHAEQIRVAPLKMGEGIVGAIAQSGQAEIVNRAEEDPRGVHIPGTPVEVHALMCAPLVSRGQVMGAVAVSRTRATGEYDQSDLDLLISLARQAAIAIENARTYAAELQQRNELARALEQERELDQLKNEFIQSLSHELRTPVTIIQGYAELLDAGELGELDQAQKQSISIITKRAADLRGLINDLTAILQTRAQEFRKTRVDLATLVRNVTVDFQLAAEQASLTLRAQLASDLPPVVGDPDHLRRALDNLVGNAIKFTPAGGTIAVRVTAEAGKVVVEVAETGVSVPGDRLDRIFDRLYQSDGSMTRRYGGTGLGLALAKEIIHAHGGELEVSGEVAKGSIFRVLLPASSGS